jgi:hypothetical protein
MKVEEGWREYKGWEIDKNLSFGPRYESGMMEEQILAEMRSDRQRAATQRYLRSRERNRRLRRWAIHAIALLIALGLIWHWARADDRRACRQDPACTYYGPRDGAGNGKGSDG